MMQQVKKCMNEAVFRLQAFLYTLLDRSKRALEGDSGMATVEMLLLIAVLIALALLFKDTIISFVSGLLDNISGQGSAFNPSTMGR